MKKNLFIGALFSLLTLTNNQLNAQSTANTEQPAKTLAIGMKHQGGIIVVLNPDGKSGLIMQHQLGKTCDWTQAVTYCENFVQGTNKPYSDWRLPTVEECRAIYKNKDLLKMIQPLWTSTEIEVKTTYHNGTAVGVSGLPRAYYFDFYHGIEVAHNKISNSPKTARAVRVF